jgi:hypothetical protein
MKRRIGIKRRLIAQRLINQRRSVLKNIDGVQRDPIVVDAHVDAAFLVSTRLPRMLSDSLAV